MTAAEDKEERLRLSGTRIELEELLQLPVDVAYEGLLTDDVSESVRKAHYATSRSLKNRLLESAQPRWRWGGRRCSA